MIFIGGLSGYVGAQSIVVVYVVVFWFLQLFVSCIECLLCFVQFASYCCFTTSVFFFSSFYSDGVLRVILSFLSLVAVLLLVVLLLSDLCISRVIVCALLCMCCLMVLLCRLFVLGQYVFVVVYSWSCTTRLLRQQICSRSLLGCFVFYFCCSDLS